MSEKVEVALRKENERLLMANKDLIDWLNYAKDQINLKDKENKRLREALEYYANIGTRYGLMRMFKEIPEGESVAIYETTARIALDMKTDWDNETTDNGPCS